MADGDRGPDTGGNSGAVNIYTDGACSGNPGPGGWGALIVWRGRAKEICGGEAETTNNRMELLAAIWRRLNDRSRLIFSPIRFTCAMA